MKSKLMTSTDVLFAQSKYLQRCDVFARHDVLKLMLCIEKAEGLLGTTELISMRCACVP